MREATLIVSLLSSILSLGSYVKGLLKDGLLAEPVNAGGLLVTD